MTKQYTRSSMAPLRRAVFDLALRIQAIPEARSSHRGWINRICAGKLHNSRSCSAGRNHDLQSEG